MFGIMVKSILVIIMFVPLCSFAVVAHPKENDEQFKASHLKNLRVVLGSEQNNETWERFIAMAAKSEDEAIAHKILSLYGSTDGAVSTMYCYHLQKFFDANPLFFVKSSDARFKHNFNAVLPCFVSESETELPRIEKVQSRLSKNSEGYPLFLKFLEQARANQSLINKGESPYEPSSTK